MSKEGTKDVEVEISPQTAKELFELASYTIQNNPDFQASLTKEYIKDPHNLPNDINFESGGERWKLTYNRGGHFDEIRLHTIDEKNRIEGIQLKLEYGWEHSRRYTMDDRKRIIGKFLISYGITNNESGEGMFCSVTNDPEAVDRVKEFISKL